MKECKKGNKKNVRVKNELEEKKEFKLQKSTVHHWLTDLSV